MRRQSSAGLYRYIGAQVRIARLKAGMSQEKLGHHVGKTRMSISNLENGRQRVPIHVLVGIAAALVADVASFLPRAATSEPDFPRLSKQDPRLEQPELRKFYVAVTDAKRKVAGP